MTIKEDVIAEFFTDLLCGECELKEPCDKKGAICKALQFILDSHINPEDVSELIERYLNYKIES
ncbi:hypothetical protein DRJ17_04625 [Candidatus Woesearchaeota archaeon]|nr:MAG: hypothetical protein DRJ17_04625 [Candidatus Woesearchaeota archaeon]